MKRLSLLPTAVALASVLTLAAAAQSAAPVPKVSDIPLTGSTAARQMNTPPRTAARQEVSPTPNAVPAFVAPPPDEPGDESGSFAAAAPVPTLAPKLAARPAPAIPVSAASTAALVVPQGTPIALQLETQLNTQYTTVGDGFAARVMTPVYYRGQEVIPSGAILEGHVMHVQDARPAVSQSELLLKPDMLVLPSGQRYTISAEVIQDDAHSAARVDTEGMLREPRGMLASDVHHTEIGGVGGFIGGAVLAGGQGAMVGAGLGAAVAVGIWLVRRRHLVLNPGSHLTVRLQRPIQLRLVASH